MDLDALKRRQSAVASRRQLAALGIERHAITAQVSAGRWQRQGTAVVLHNGELTDAQRLWVAVLDQTQPCLLGGITAAIAGGLRTFPRPLVHVVVPRSARPRPRPGIVVHRTELPIRVPRSGIPRVSMARAVVQAGIWEPVARTAAGVLIAACQQRLASVRELQSELDLAGRQRHITVMRTHLLEVEQGAGSVAEVEFAALVRRSGLPTPRRQAQRQANGRRYLDFDFGRFAVEIDGPMHWSDAVEEDLTRQNALVRSGQRLLRFTTTQIRYEPETVIAELRAAWRELAA